MRHLPSLNLRGAHHAAHVALELPEPHVELLQFTQLRVRAAKLHTALHLRAVSTHRVARPRRETTLLAKLPSRLERGWTQARVALDDSDCRRAARLTSVARDATCVCSSAIASLLA